LSAKEPCQENDPDVAVSQDLGSRLPALLSGPRSGFSVIDQPSSYWTLDQLEQPNQHSKDQQESGHGKQVDADTSNRHISPLSPYFEVILLLDPADYYRFLCWSWKEGPATSRGLVRQVPRR
ncbi:MAG TPA: hypothetical protein VFR28_02130, partial [Allosphingosinicella sp.]|nr:hypothetical protein [Allosphingosinicella sp.]